MSTSGENTPCMNPRVCGVQSHRPGTVPECRRGGRGNGGRPMSAENAGRLSAPLPMAELKARDTQKLQNLQETRHTLDEWTFRLRSEQAKEWEPFEKIMSNDGFTEWAKDLDSSPENSHMWASMQSEAVIRGWVTEENSHQVLNAIRLSQSGPREERQKARAMALTKDPYIQQHTDSMYMAQEDGDESAESEARSQMEARLTEICYDGADIDELSDVVYQASRDRIESQAVVDASSAPHGTPPEWKPFNVEEARMRAEIKRGLNGF